MTGAILRALRESRDWDPPDLAREMRLAAGRPLAAELTRMVYAWEAGRHRPSPRYMRLYRRIFPELGAVEGDDPAAVLQRARRITLEAEAARRQAAEASGKPDLDAATARMEQLIAEVDEKTAQLQELLAETARIQEAARKRRRK